MLGAPATPVRQAKLQMAAVAKLPEMRRQFRIMQRQLAELRGELQANDSDQPTDKAA
jgi:hypothetical protein